MPKFNYFDALEQLSKLCTKAVSLCCHASMSSTPTELFATLQIATNEICNIEKNLFSDFMPPLERNSIAACAHSLYRVIVCCTDISKKSIRSSNRSFPKVDIYISLAKAIENEIFRIRKIKRSEEIPGIWEFRNMLDKLSNDTKAIDLSQERLKNELSLCYDSIIEVMLINI